MHQLEETSEPTQNSFLLKIVYLGKYSRRYNFNNKKIGLSCVMANISKQKVIFFNQNNFLYNL